MTTELVPTIPDLALIEAREYDTAIAVRGALEACITMLQAADIDTSDGDAVTYRGLGLARAVYPLLDEIEALAKKVRQRADHLIGSYLTATRLTGVVLGGVPYTYKAKPGNYTYDAEKLHQALKTLVGKVLTVEEFTQVAPAIVIPEQVIPARTEYRIDGTLLARILKKRGNEPVALFTPEDEQVLADDERGVQVPPVTISFEGIVNRFRTRDPGQPRLARESK